MTADALQDSITDAADTQAGKRLMSWTACSTDEVLQAVAEMVHFSFKYTSTNATGGVRLAAGYRLDGPYVALSTVGNEDAAVDYSRSAPVTRQALALLQGRHKSLYANIPPQFSDDFVAQLRVPNEAAEVECDLVPHRLRQVIVQDEAGNDIALTPLVSAAFFRMVQDRLHEHYALSEAMETVKPTGVELRPVRRGYLHYGGSNPFNGGKQLVQLRRPLWFAAPVENRKIRKAFAFHHKGIDLAVSPRAVKELRGWRKRIAHTKAATTRAARAGGDPQLEMIAAIAAPVVARARAASALLERMREYLPRYGSDNPQHSGGTPLTSPQLAAHMRALLDPGCRYQGWKHDVAYHIYMRIISSTFSERRRPTTVGLAEPEANRVWVQAIEDLL